MPCLSLLHFLFHSQKIKMFNTLSGMWSRWWDASNQKGEIHGTIFGVSVTIFAILWSIWTVLKKSRKISAPLPPGPRGLPIVGYLPFLGTDLHRKFTELAGVYGPIYKLWLGNKLCVVLSSPSLVKEVVRDQDTTFANRDAPVAALAITYYGNDIAFSSYGPEWRKLRKIFVREMLSQANLDASYVLRKQEVKKSIRDLYDKIGTPIRIGELTLVTEINTVMSMVWGGTVDGETEKARANVAAEFREVMSEIVVLLGKPNISDIFPMLARFDLQGIEKQMKKNARWCEGVFNSTIEQRMKAPKEEGIGKNETRTDFLQFLLELVGHEDAARSITMTQLMALLVDIVLGGTDTVATAVEWVMAELMLHPEIMKKVQEELAEVVGLNNTVEEFHLSKLQYLDAVVKEGLRLHTPLPLLVPRSPSLTSNVGGYTIPKKTKIFLNVWAIHRNPQLWDNPLEFRPERFLNDRSKWDYSGNNFQYLPFGSGRRLCAGIPLGEKMQMYVLASFLHSFKWKLPNGTKLELSENFGIVLKKKIPLVVIPTPRLSNLELYA